MTSKLARLLVGVAMGAGAVGVILALAGVHSPVRTGLVLLFLAVAPTAAIAGLLRNFDPFARLILAAASTIAVLSIVGMVLLAAGLWSPIGELLGVAAITVACLALQRPAVRARLAGWARPPWQALLRHIPGVRTAVAEAELAAEADGEVADTDPADVDVDTAEVPGRGQAELDGAELDRAELDRAELDRVELDGAGAESTAGAETAGSTEVTTPLPAISD